MFKVNARTLIHLGAELISSDAVAFYEVIKNSFDAKSETVKIEVASRIDHDELEFVRELIAEQRSEADDLDDEELSEILDGICEQLTLDELDPDDTLAESLEMVGTLDELEAAVDAANYIEISDTGVGMSMQDLQDIYLTIGTPVRYKERQEMTGGAGDDERPILGEKGIGRLSVMRLGWKLQVRTTRAGDPHWHVLDIDWRAFNDVDKMIEDIEVAPRKGEKKEDRAVHGTVLHVSALAAGWSEDKLSQIAREQLSKFMDRSQPLVDFRSVCASMVRSSLFRACKTCSLAMRT